MNRIYSAGVLHYRQKQEGIVMEHNCGWLECGDWNSTDEEQARLLCFRKTLYLQEVSEQFQIRISADTRYRLFINGSFVQYGPSKGDYHVWFCDVINLAPYLHTGENTIAVWVLHYPADPKHGNHSMFRYETARLFIDGIQLNGWKSRIDRGTGFYAEEQRFAPLWIHEHSAETDTAWRENGFDDSGWSDCVICSQKDLPETLRPENLNERTIPFMKRTMHDAQLPVSELPADSVYKFVIDAGEEMTAFVHLELEGSKGSEIELLYSECYETGNGKGDRTDSVHGHLSGYRDRIHLISDGTAVFEPFWFRTFRYIEVTVHAAEPLKLTAFRYEETGYPLEVKSTVTVSDPDFSKIWDISLRTLRRCMQETYTDCPFYEQLQYVMDTRSQILYTYAVSADDRLARKAIDDFARAQRPDGLLNCSYPNTNVNVIPGFSVYYILILHDHMMYFGDRALIRQYLPVVHRILAFFHASLNEQGLVRKIGGINETEPFWSFIDWAQDWMETTGMPKAGRFGPVTLESELYLYGLNHAAELCAFAGDDHELQYRNEAADLKQSIRNSCMKDGLITDGPGCDDISQQGQVFGVLSGIFSEKEGRAAMKRTLDDPSVTGCTVATSWYLFRALEKTGLYEYTNRYWEIWRNMIRNHCTTCVEGEYYPRSECHAWGALALYELPSAVLGVRPGSIGYETILVSPAAGSFTSAEGTAVTPHGTVHVRWTLQDGELHPEIEASDAVKQRIITK